MTAPPLPSSALVAAELLAILPPWHRVLALTLAVLTVLAVAASGDLSPSVASAPASSAPAVAAPTSAVVP